MIFNWLSSLPRSLHSESTNVSAYGSELNAYPHPNSNRPAPLDVDAQSRPGSIPEQEIATGFGEIGLVGGGSVVREDLVGIGALHAFDTGSEEHLAPGIEADVHAAFALHAVRIGGVSTVSAAAVGAETYMEPQAAPPALDPGVADAEAQILVVDLQPQPTAGATALPDDRLGVLGG